MHYRLRSELSMPKPEGLGSSPSVAEEATVLLGLFQKILTADPDLIADVEGYIEDGLAISPQLKRCVRVLGRRSRNRHLFAMGKSRSSFAP